MPVVVKGRDEERDIEESGYRAVWQVLSALRSVDKSLVCIPSPPPDLDCKDIPYRRFKVLPPDPHGFDRDGDGIGCER